MSQSNVNRTGCEPIPGYILRRRLGAGGYGEVWAADAPGGLQKAIKLVYGSLNDQHARSELRSLQRIREVHHPFILSLERIEVVNGQLIIVTELAEGSLVDCFHAARRRQLQGIPRDQLLDYLRDAGDALDYLSQKHDLQHLDIKPGNLLIMAERIKVADFGLIKDLQAPNVSMVSGLTPSHAAPELFDGRPDRLSDLYSLAIVYQEMLTGKLPFEGKTAGELARQHLHQAPNLEPLPPADRRVVARALAKHPHDRFSSCRAFIEELRRSSSQEKYSHKAWTNGFDSAESQDAPEAEEPLASPTRTSPASLSGIEFMPALPTAESSEGWQPPLCMFIGLGGTGGLALTTLRHLLDTRIDSGRSVSDHQWLAIDTDLNFLAEICNPRCPGAIDNKSVFHLKLGRPQDYRSRGEDRFNAISRRWLYNIPRSLQTEGVRPIGMLALVDHYREIEQRIYQQLKTLVHRHQTNCIRDCQPLRVYICSSLHGGTGGAIAAEIGRIARNVLDQLNVTDYVLCSTLSLAMTTNGSGGLPAAAGLAALSELSAHMESEVFIPTIGMQSAKAKSGRPFDWVTIIDGGVHGVPENFSHTLESLAESMWVDSHTLIGPTLDVARHKSVDQSCGQQHAWLRTSRCSQVKLEVTLDPALLARACCVNAIHQWQDCLDSQASHATPSEAESDRPDVSSKPDAAIVEQMSDECLSALRLLPNSVTRESSANPWRHRVSNCQESLRLQIEKDLRTCRQWQATNTRPTHASWELMQRVILRTIERMMELARADEQILLDLFAEGTQDSEAFDHDKIGSMRSYIESLAGKFVEQLQASQPQIGQFTTMITAWKSSLDAEQKMRGQVNGNIDWSNMLLPDSWQPLLPRVHSILDATFHHYVSYRCFNITTTNSNHHDSGGGSLSLEHILRLSCDLITRLIREAGRASSNNSTSSAGSNMHSVSLQDIQGFIPQTAQNGGRLYRIFAVTNSQRSEITQRIAQIGISEDFTLVPAQFGEEPVTVCDGNDLNIPALISDFWHPTAETFQLAERLHTRSDVVWPPMDALLAKAVPCEANA